MTGFLGADPNDLIGQGEVMLSHATRVDELAEALSSAVTAVEWAGPDRDSWEQWARAVVDGTLADMAVRLEGGGRHLVAQAADQELTSSSDGRVDDPRYAELLGGQAWSDLINGAQELWELSPFDDPITVRGLGGRFLDSPEGAGSDPASVDLSAEAIASQRMRQGTLGDCWFLSGLMATAQSDPDFLARNVRWTGSSWDVTLYEDGHPVTVAVTPDQLVRDGARAEVLEGDDARPESAWENDEIGYMSIYEQAAINHLGPDYESVVADTPAAGLELITGAPAESTSLATWSGQPSLEELETALGEGRPITVMTDPLMPFRQDLSAAHVYQVSGVDAATNEVILQNPWGTDGG